MRRDVFDLCRPSVASLSSIDVAAVDAAGVWLPLPSSCVPAEVAFPSANHHRTWAYACGKAVRKSTDLLITNN